MFLASMKSQAVGLSLAVAIALHNVPEGVAVALPVYFATKSRWLGFKYAFLSGTSIHPRLAHCSWSTADSRSGQTSDSYLHVRTDVSGLAEPAAVIVVALFVPVELSNDFVEQMLAAVAGIMTWITLHELLPSAFAHAGREGTIVSFYAGMALMSGNLWLLEHYVGDDH